MSDKLKLSGKMRTAPMDKKPEPNVMTLATFRALREETNDIGALLKKRFPKLDYGFDPEDEPTAGWVYDDAYIYKVDDGRVVLGVYNYEVARPSADHLPELEVRLYEWSVVECMLQDGSEFDREEAFTISLACTFADKLLKTLGWKDFDEMCHRNKSDAAYQNGECASHDFCDANMDMYDAYCQTCEIFGITRAADLNDALPVMNAAWDFARANLMNPVHPRIANEE